ncbi:uncharacterized protein F4822DRAFT_389309 [Hypoxylon trugodes]|uniref:uncharacterized protein n=1 Tax=Hypoxylon trugodes TaxID=326681 RepID=UPI0021987B7E|nr:uncharacterized protein F4822DRAFT_389309 [Hypoxylon trugodes]KAI1392002.1 hypothetical protein F4822DRAFT_389309 [Hypoxylon trugodes]
MTDNDRARESGRRNRPNPNHYSRNARPRRHERRVPSTVLEGEAGGFEYYNAHSTTSYDTGDADTVDTQGDTNMTNSPTYNPDPCPDTHPSLDPSAPLSDVPQGSSDAYSTAHNATLGDYGRDVPSDPSFQTSLSYPAMTALSLVATSSPAYTPSTATMQRSDMTPYAQLAYYTHHDDGSQVAYDAPTMSSPSSMGALDNENNIQVVGHGFQGQVGYQSAAGNDQRYGRRWSTHNNTGSAV